jgi:hypothetical protein
MAEVRRQSLRSLNAGSLKSDEPVIYADDNVGVFHLTT